jgi:hypothetical protein
MIAFCYVRYYPPRSLFLFSFCTFSHIYKNDQFSSRLCIIIIIINITRIEKLDADMNAVALVIVTTPSSISVTCMYREDNAMVVPRDVCDVALTRHNSLLWEGTLYI